MQPSHDVFQICATVDNVSIALKIPAINALLAGLGLRSCHPSRPEHTPMLLCIPRPCSEAPCPFLIEVPHLTFMVTIQQYYNTVVKKI